MPKIKQILTKLGLEDQEAKTYLALLDLNEATATKLAERTGIGRVNMYQITNKLIEKGLISYIVKNNVKYFSSADPETLLKDLQEKEKELQKILPELKARQKLSIQETKVEVYRGKEGINTILKMILRNKKDYFMIGGAEECLKECKSNMRIFVKHGEKLRIKGKFLERKDAEFFVGKHEEYKFISKELIALTTLTIWNNKVATFVWTRPFYVILIENEQIAKSNLATFNYLWKTAEIPTKKDRNKRILDYSSS